MEVEFTERPDGQVDANLGSAYPIFNEALSDAVSSLPPRWRKRACNVVSEIPSDKSAASTP